MKGTGYRGVSRIGPVDKEQKSLTILKKIEVCRTCLREMFLRHYKSPALNNIEWKHSKVLPLNM